MRCVCEPGAAQKPAGAYSTYRLARDARMQCSHRGSCLTWLGIRFGIRIKLVALIHRGACRGLRDSMVRPYGRHGMATYRHPHERSRPRISGRSLLTRRGVRRSVRTSVRRAAQSSRYERACVCGRTCGARANGTFKSSRAYSLCSCNRFSCTLKSRSTCCCQRSGCAAATRSTTFLHICVHGANERGIVRVRAL